MKTLWQGRMVRGAARYGEHAPMATACCNACRTCVQTNVLALALGGLVAAGAAVAALARRLLARPS